SKPAEARDALARAKGLLHATSEPADRFRVALLAERLRARTPRAPSSAWDLDTLAANARVTEFPELLFEARLARAEALQLLGKTHEAVPLLDEIERSARGLGFVRLARKAADLRGIRRSS